MAADPGNQRAVAEAEHLARLYRRAGFPEAHAVPDYCIDELNHGGWYTYTVCVYVGDKNSETAPPFYKKLIAKLGSARRWISAGKIDVVTRRETEQ